MLYGATTNAPITPADDAVMKAGRFNTFKLMYHHNAADVRAVRAACPDVTFCVRLPDSRRADGTYPSAFSYAAECLTIVRHFYDYGVRYFQVDNEPQFLWDQLLYGPWQYQWWLRNVMRDLKPSVPGDVRLISPPLSFSPALWRHGPPNPTPFVLDEWFAAFAWTDAGQRASLWHLFDAVGATCYFQSERQAIDPSYGASYNTVHGKAGGALPVVVTEWGSSLCDRNPRPPREELERAMMDWYPVWLRAARGSGKVVQAHAFVMPGATPDWSGFYLSDPVARRMASAMGRTRGVYQRVKK